MSKSKGRGLFRRMIDTAKGAMGIPVTKHYDDSVIRQLPDRIVDRHGRTVKKKIKKPMKCEPGDVLYHDKLVRHFGRRKADGYHQCIQRGFLGNLPTEQDFIDNPAWAWR